MIDDNEPVDEAERFELTTGDLRAVVAPGCGGRVAQIAVGGTPLIVDRFDGAGALGWGCYPMVPWAGRIRDGRFTFRGRIVELPRTFGPHAIHGVGYAPPWAVDHLATSRAELALALPTDLRWPFGGIARQRIEVRQDGVRLELSVTAGAVAFPATIGWHPWFRKPDAVRFEPTAMYRRDRHHVAVDELVPVPPGPWDDCFVNREPVGLTIDDVDVVLTSDCTSWVVYDERAYATCVEPQTGPPDGPNIRPHPLEPGQTLAAWFDLAIRRR